MTNLTHRRPFTVNLTAIRNNKSITVRGTIGLTVGLTNSSHPSPLGLPEAQSVGSTPWEHLSLFSFSGFRVKLVGRDQKAQIILEKSVPCESFGVFTIKIPNQVADSSIVNLELYEIGFCPGVEYLLGSYIPLAIEKDFKLLITDFDKTLVETRYSTAREMYDSLRKPISHFPRIEESIALIKTYVRQGHHPFVLSASPHFYEKAFRDWLYANGIYTSHIFLKDYHKLLSMFESELTSKDFKKQGFYKLNELVHILLMTGIPKSLVLVGDGFESDTAIYLAIKALLEGFSDPRKLWKSLKGLPHFEFNRKQQSKFLTKFYQLYGLLQKSDKPDVKIHIRCPSGQKDIISEKDLGAQILNQLRPQVQFYAT